MRRRLLVQSDECMLVWITDRTETKPEKMSSDVWRSGRLQIRMAKRREWDHPSYTRRFYQEWQSLLKWIRVRKWVFRSYLHQCKQHHICRQLPQLTIQVYSWRPNSWLCNFIRHPCSKLKLHNSRLSGFTHLQLSMLFDRSIFRLLRKCCRHSYLQSLRPAINKSPSKFELSHFG